MFLPTPGSACTTGTPIFPRCSGSPTPDSCRMCGEPIAPADRITSRAASARSTTPLRENSTPTARLPSNRTRCTSALVTSSRFGRFSAGRRYVRAVFEPDLLAGLDHGRADRRPVGPRGEQRPLLAAYLAAVALPAFRLAE